MSYNPSTRREKNNDTFLWYIVTSGRGGTERSGSTRQFRLSIHSCSLTGSRKSEPEKTETPGIDSMRPSPRVSS